MQDIAVWWGVFALDTAAWQSKRDAIDHTHATNINNLCMLLLLLCPCRQQQQQQGGGFGAFGGSAATPPKPAGGSMWQPRK